MALELLDSGLLDALRTMRVFCRCKRGKNPKARNCAERKGDEETGGLGEEETEESLLSGLAVSVAVQAPFSCLRLLAFPRVAHEVERQGGVDLHAGLDGARNSGEKAEFSGWRSWEWWLGGGESSLVPGILPAFPGFGPALA